MDLSLPVLSLYHFCDSSTWACIAYVHSGFIVGGNGLGVPYNIMT